MTQWRELPIAGAWEITPELHSDDRGVNAELFRAGATREATGRDFTTAQVNCSVSKAGVLRGVHLALGPDGTLAGGQEKYVTVASGSVFDVVVDLRSDSPTFGKWEAVLLSGERRNAVFLSAGLGHAVLALTEDTVLLYLCSSEYDPRLERSVDALDPALAIAWPSKDAHGHAIEFLRSERDHAALRLAEAIASGTLPER
ncbi:dTDP-4-dehydrorhamnose 3,5-epimerase family protein [Segniliparus rugosus]|uniref:dTDP-4-dehydrorhamnose 3,5-epimerase n=1 Tax=Segniliparus rugosus (strain ATCC BAA-974 / DSM 45345 / CCUG 50838 / CIP 108380 / JCM 13579 / CDC 945) TaxID=679197 RepID=E5XL72_SEGRC|nr:dTDP-4-dehydrorhamnose 3,5-epimerase family protein [Segniliparus rugosus]EFV14940.1 dTDP-4-dehydrorhamnose 3,5-epimerase [Segniliparus rugosus ATCC BAA-974]